MNLNKLKNYLEGLKEGCHKHIYIDNGQTTYDTGWKCGERFGNFKRENDEICLDSAFYCKDCKNLILITIQGVSDLEEILEARDG